MGANQNLYSVLEVPGFTRKVRLGCMPEERSVPQDVDFQIKIGFYHELTAEKTDELGETVCYAKMSEAVAHLVEAKEYKLVEKLARDVYEEIEKFLPEKTTLQVKIHKLKPPIDVLTKGVFYFTGDMSL